MPRSSVSRVSASSCLRARARLIPLAAAALAAAITLSARAQTPAALTATASYAAPYAPPVNGLLFYLSADKGTTADVAAPGTAVPTYVNDVDVIKDGARGPGLACDDYQRLAFTAPGNIYAEHGTLSFFWRSRYEVGPTAFPVFRVAFGDHSSWDMAWLRIDYNGHGFDAFVTDASLARVRVSVPLEQFPSPKTWTHLAVTWDETHGIHFYINGKLAAKNETVAVLNTALDQFGPHSRIISPHQVQSDYNFTRGGDIDEIRIYDRPLAEADIATLAQADATPPALNALAARSLNDRATHDEWYMRYGFDRRSNPPELPAGKNVAIRKVEIHEAYDIKRWWWKATDGIRETTWPGVYNRSRLPGRNDYFQLPDWDCYVDSGKAITFALPDEPVNHIEISGAAYGKMELLPKGTENEMGWAAKAESTLFERPKGEERTINTFKDSSALAGRKIRFSNVAQETPIGELVAYNVTAGTEPAGSKKLAYRLTGLASDRASEAAIKPLVTYIDGRFPADERAMMVAVPADSYKAQTMAGTRVNSDLTPAAPAGLPLVHVIIPDDWDKLSDGLDGIAIDLPALNVKPTHGGDFALNIQVKDPLWPMRQMLDFTAAVKPGEAKTLWLDLRDRILPAKKSFWLSLAGSGGDFSTASLEGAQVRLVFKPREAARPEHELDRLTQAKDTYAMLVEEHPNSPKLNMWVRFKGDLEDLLRVNPEHELGREYAAAAGVQAGNGRNKFTQPTPPEGVPLWAFRQVYLLGQVQKFIDFYIDHRQSEFGDFGGGISDDVDLLNTWPGVALMGAEPEKIMDSDRRLIEAAFKNGMFTNGLPTIQADELHSYEEGINCLAQNLISEHGDPQLLERAMVTAKGIEWLSGVNSAGHRHIRSSYYNGKKAAEDGPWGWEKPYSFLVCQVPQLLVDFNGSPQAKKIQLELTDGLLAHAKTGENGRVTLPTAIHFADDREGDYGRGYFPWHMFWASYKWTGDKKYLAPIVDGGSAMSVNANVFDLLGLRKDWAARNAPAEGGRRPSPDGPGRRAAGFRGSNNEHFAWQADGDKKHLEQLYGSQIESVVTNEYVETEGSLWIDRVGVPTAELQRARLGGVALLRNALYPGHVISWKFAAPATGESVAVLVPDATPTGFKVIAYNLKTSPVQATMTGWNIDPGIWEITQGTSAKNEDNADGAGTTREVKFGRSTGLDLTLAPRTTTILTLKLKTPGQPYWSRPDVGFTAQDVSVSGGGDALLVKLHSLGSVPAPASKLVLRDASGKVLVEAATPAIAAPVDLEPKTTSIMLRLPRGTAPKGLTLEFDPDNQIEEITRMNNRVTLQQ